MQYELETAYNSRSLSSSTHGEKDGFPYPVDRGAYDNSIRVLQESLDSARLDEKERYDAIKRLGEFVVGVDC